MNTNITIQGWLNQLVPLQQISHVVGQVLPAFVIVGVFILAIGYMMMLASPCLTLFAPKASLSRGKDR